MNKSQATTQTLNIVSLVPRPLPRFYLIAVQRFFSTACEIKSGQRPGNEVNRFHLAAVERFFSIAVRLIWAEAWEQG